MIAIVILAAGRSRRMGVNNKLLMPFGTSSMLKQVTQIALASKAEQVVVVTGHEQHKVQQQLAQLPLEFIHNDEYDSGKASSIGKGIRSLDQSVSGVIIMLGDMPLVETQHLNCLIDRFEALPEDAIVVPYTSEQRGNPLLWGCSHFGALQSLTGEQGGKELLAHFSSKINYVALPSSAIHMDFDTPDSLLSAPHTELIRRQFPLLAQQDQSHALCYLDSSATTPMPQVVLDTMYQFETGSRSNVGRGSHHLARRADQAFDLARQQVASYVGAASKEEIIFTSGTTMGINLLASSLAQEWETGDEIVISKAEHHSNSLPWISLAKRHGFCLKIIPLLAEGRLDLSKLSSIIGPRCRLVAVTHVSNVTGAVSDLTTLVKAAHTLGAQVLVDGAQAVAHGPIDVSDLGVDYYVFSGHKCYGPTGIGVIWGKLGALNKLKPFFTGGGMVHSLDLASLSMTIVKGTSRFEAGTPPIAQAVGLGAALQWLSQLPWAFIKQQQGFMCQYLLEYLMLHDQIFLLGPHNNEARQPIISFTHTQHHAHDIVHLLDQHGIATRGGHHCAQPLMQHFDVMASTRVSLGVFNTMTDIKYFINSLQQAITTLEA